MNKKERMQELIAEINKHNYNYYTLMMPTISDAEYDKLYYELVDLEEETGATLENSPTQRVGNFVLKEFKKREHKVRLYSLSKVRSISDLEKWMQEMKELSPGTSFSLEYKFDGLQLVLEYEDGHFKRATTRGDGRVGEDVTRQVRTIKSVPLSIPYKEDLIVQGEGMMTQSSLKKYNETATEVLKNARNGVAGAIRNLDPNETAKRNLDFFCYSVLSGKEFDTQQEMNEFLKSNGFLTGEYFVVAQSVKEVEKEINLIDEKKESLDVMIDGMVIKVNDCSHREEIGYTNKFPKWAMAYKFEAQEVSTMLENVVWQVGRTGKVTPIAELSPVVLAGATVTRATLNNIDDINKKKVKIGSRVLVRRSNEVIPEVLGILEDLEGSKVITEPEKCPSCGTKLMKKGAILFCPNVDGCKEQVVDRLAHFASKNAFNIEGMSEKTIELLYENKGVCRPSDLFELKKEDFLSLEKFKDKKASNMCEAISSSKKVAFDKFIFSLGIPEVGEVSARALKNNFLTLDELINSNEEELKKIEDIGEVIAKTIVDYFKNEKNLSEIKKLISLGVQIVYEDSRSVESELSGKKIVLTGTLSLWSRDEASEKIRKLGGITVSSVSKQTDFCLAGENAGSKLDKAKALGVKILTEDEFKKIIEKYNI